MAWRGVQQTPSNHWRGEIVSCTKAETAENQWYSWQNKPVLDASRFTEEGFFPFLFVLFFVFCFCFWCRSRIFSGPKSSNFAPNHHFKQLNSVRRCLFCFQAKCLQPNCHRNWISMGTCEVSLLQVWRVLQLASGKKFVRAYASGLWAESYQIGNLWPGNVHASSLHWLPIAWNANSSWNPDFPDDIFRLRILWDASSFGHLSFVVGVFWIFSMELRYMCLTASGVGALGHFLALWEHFRKNWKFLCSTPCTEHPPRLWCGVEFSLRSSATFTHLSGLRNIPFSCFWFEKKEATDAACRPDQG